MLLSEYLPISLIISFVLWKLWRLSNFMRSFWNKFRQWEAYPIGAVYRYLPIIITHLLSICIIRQIPNYPIIYILQLVHNTGCMLFLTKQTRGFPGGSAGKNPRQCRSREGNGTHSSPLVWKISWTEEPGGLQSMGSLGVRHNWATNTFTFHFHALEKETATHSSVLAWRTPGTGEPDGLPSMGSHRVRHNWSDLAAAVQEIRVQSLGHEDPLEEKMATHCSTLSWRILWTEEPSGLQSLGSQVSDTT